MPTWLSLLLYPILFSGGLAVTWLPRRLELGLGRAFGRFIMVFGGFKRRVAYDNIRHCLPELGPEGWGRLLSKNQEHMGILFFEFLHFFSPVPGHWRAYADRISRLEGLPNWERAHAKGKGVLFVACHVGFWEMLAAAGGLAGYKPTVVTTVIKPAWLNARIVACRESTGVRHAFHPGSIPTVMKALRRGESVAFMNDQYAGPPMGMPVLFFGARVGTLAAVAPLAKRSGAAIVPVSCFRDGDGILRVQMEPELELGADLDDTGKATQLLASKVEGWVRRNPDQWLWIHRRFKNVVWKEAAVPA